MKLINSSITGAIISNIFRSFENDFKIFKNYNEENFITEGDFPECTTPLNKKIKYKISAKRTKPMTENEEPIYEINSMTIEFI